MDEVSVVIPTRGTPAFLDEAVASIVADSSAESEIILVEDGTRLVDRRRLRRLAPTAELVVLPHVGRSAARNEGVRRASCELVAFLDADDVSLAGRLGGQAAALMAAPDAGLCFGRVEGIDEASEPVEWLTEVERQRFTRLLERGPSYESLLLDCPIYTSATMVRREAFVAVNGYRSDLDTFEDLDLYLRLAETGGLLPCANGPLALHRLHPGNTASDYLFAGSLRLAELHLRRPDLSVRARRLLVEREIESLWGLGDFVGVRKRLVHAVRADPGVLFRPGVRRSLVASVLPASLLREVRRRRR